MHQYDDQIDIKPGWDEKNTGSIPEAVKLPPKWAMAVFFIFTLLVTGFVSFLLIGEFNDSLFSFFSAPNAGALSPYNADSISQLLFTLVIGTITPVIILSLSSWPMISKELFTKSFIRFALCEFVQITTVFICGLISRFTRGPADNYISQIPVPSSIILGFILSCILAIALTWKFSSTAEGNYTL